jgi:hypothetical protein
VVGLKIAEWRLAVRETAASRLEAGRSSIASSAFRWSRAAPRFTAVTTIRCRVAAGPRFDQWQIGGNHAQRDVVDWTLTEAAVSAGHRDVALSLAHERLATRPRRAPTRRFLRHAESILAYRAWCAGSCDLSIAGCIGSSGRGRGCNWV